MDPANPPIQPDQGRCQADFSDGSLSWDEHALADDGSCVQCGKQVNPANPHPEASDAEYRVSWQMVDPIQVEQIEAAHGKDAWKNSDAITDPSLRWHPSERVTTDEVDARDQYETLRGWCLNHEQPIKNLKLEVREPPSWETIG